MGACLGTNHGQGQHFHGQGHDDSDTNSEGRGRGRHRRRGRRRGGGHESPAFSDSTSSAGGGGNGSGVATKNRPLRQEGFRWKSDIPLTEGQLKSKRDEFWDTAPAFEGKEEIWAALKAAAEAVETSKDFELAQAILDGAGISLPHGSLVECYDELGTRYAIPVYCLSYPVNIVVESDGGGSDSPAEYSEPVNGEVGTEYKIRLRVSLTSKDVKLVVNTAETVASAKRKLHEQEKMGEPAKQRWYYAGKLLGDKSRIGDANIPAGHVVQCVVNNLDFDVLSAR